MKHPIEGCFYFQTQRMIYRQFAPHPALKDYIDAYWMATGSTMPQTAERILPDGCVDIIINLGNDCITDEGKFTIRYGTAFLVGAMTRFKETWLMPDTRLIGIRFKPGAFTAFYQFGSLHEITDQTIDFGRKDAPGLQLLNQDFAVHLDRFFLNRLQQPRHTLMPVIAAIQSCKGQTTVAAQATAHFTTTRQLERLFKQHIGIGPKTFISITRNQHALTQVRNNTGNRSLLEIACSCGFYDHAHLTRELSRFAGVTPGSL